MDRLSGTNFFSVYQKGIVSKQIHGKIDYKVVLEIKNFKYRYTFSDFVFHYYKQDRTYKMVPTGKTKSLNEKKAAGWQKTWARHKSYTTQLITNLANSLKAQMAPAIKPANPIKSGKPSGDF